MLGVICIETLSTYDHNHNYFGLFQTHHSTGRNIALHANQTMNVQVPLQVRGNNHLDFTSSAGGMQSKRGLVMPAEDFLKLAAKHSNPDLAEMLGVSPAVISKRVMSASQSLGR